MPDNETYLGDRLYASFDGESIRLRAPRDGGDHEVFLDEDTFLALLRFMRMRTGEDDRSTWIKRGLRSISSKENR